MPESLDSLFHPDAWFRPGGGSRYLQLARHLAAAIKVGRLEPQQQLPPERDLAEIAEVSRVTVRKAIAELVTSGLVAQRRGAGTFVLGTAPKTEHSLLSLVSFSENMQAQGRTSSSEVLGRGLFPPSPDEMMTLGLSSRQQVARIDRLRSADGTPMAVERSSLPADVLPDPTAVGASLYAVLRQNNQAPSRAIQRVKAVNAGVQDAELLGVPEGTAILSIDRTAFHATGRPIEFTRGLYRSDIYDFVNELRPEH